MEDFEIPDLSQRQTLAVFLVAGIAIGASATYVSLDAEGVSKQEAAQEVVSTLEAQTGQELELINVKAESGLYRVDIKDSNDRLSTFYVTRDGSLVTGSMTDLQETKELATARRQFSNCLQDRNVVMFGNRSQQETQAQFQLLGGESYVSPIYVDVSSQDVLQQARKLGVTMVPAFYYNGSVSEGVMRPSGVANFTGCSYSSS
jgi:hypothetical protein